MNCGLKKPSLNHFHIWGCPIETRPYKPNEMKLDSRFVSCYFVGYFERSRGFKFYDPKLKLNLFLRQLMLGFLRMSILWREIQLETLFLKKRISLFLEMSLVLNRFPHRSLLMTQFKTMLMENLPENKLSLLKKLCH